MKKLGLYLQGKQPIQNEISMKKGFRRSIMREEYNIKNLNPRKNPYAKLLKKQVTINLDEKVILYFKGQAENSGIPYQTLINLYLRDCMEKKKELELSWK